MAKNKGPLFSVSAHGSIGNSLTFFTDKGRNKTRRHFKPRNPQTSSQQLQRSYLNMAILAWRDLTPVERSQWAQNALRAGKTFMSGYNYFLSDYITTRLQPVPPVPTPVLDNLVTWWKMNEGTGPTAYDSIGNNDLVVNNASWVQCGDDWGLQYDGLTNYSYINNFVGFPWTNNFTVEFWVRYDSGIVSPFGNFLTTYTNKSNTGIFFNHGYDAGEAFFFHKYGLGNVSWAWTKDYNFHHLVFLQKPTGMYIYFDSNFKTNNANTSAPGNPGNGWICVGAFKDSPGGTPYQRLQGTIACIRIYQKALSDDEIVNNFNAGF